MNFFLILVNFFRHCYIFRPSDSTVSEDAGSEPRSVANLALAVRRSNHSAIDLIQFYEITFRFCKSFLQLLRQFHSKNAEFKFRKK
jgi:hypothetical protein